MKRISYDSVKAHLNHKSWNAYHCYYCVSYQNKTSMDTYLKTNIFDITQFNTRHDKNLYDFIETVYIRLMGWI